jgi:23S rRNA pseudouridine1911/1915/1917 synthase
MPDPNKPEVTLKLAIRANSRIGFGVAHEDADLLVIDKPAGVVVQPGKGHASDSLLNGLFVKYGKLLHNLGERRDFGLLHRLDKDTSGLLLVAKMPSAYDQLRRDFEDRKIDKEYLTLVIGIPKKPQGVIQARLKEVEVPATGGPEKWEGQGSHHVGQRLKRATHTAKYGGGTIKKVMVSNQGQEAISAYQVLAIAKTKTPGKPPVDVALVRVRIKTGRLHQIRAHMLFLGTPVIGDDIYTLAGPKPGSNVPSPTLLPPRLCLHAAHLGFKHPMTGKWLHIESPLPADLAAYARKLGLKVAANAEPTAASEPRR